MIIGITGHARNGKDTIADIMVSKWKFEKRSFARPMKEACKIMFGWTDEHVYGSLKDVVDFEYGITPRLALQTLGTEWGQIILCEKSDLFKETTGRSLWAKRVLKDCENKNIVIADLRFIHEAEEIIKQKGIIIRVIRDGFESMSTHSSETEMESIKEDVTIFNSGSLDDLQSKVIGLMDILRSDN